jgi:hypothetical protein
MTIKWVQADPLVMNGEPFCYGSRVTVRQLLEMRAGGYDLTRILTDHPELRPRRRRRVLLRGRPRSGGSFAADSTLAGPGYTDERQRFPEQFRRPGVVVAAVPAGLTPRAWPGARPARYSIRVMRPTFHRRWYASAWRTCTRPPSA